MNNRFSQLSKGIAASVALATASIAFAQARPDAPHQGISLVNMDPAIKPGDDFYHYANGGYIAHTPLPDDHVSVGVFATLDDTSFKNIANIIADATKTSAAPGSDQRKIGDLYKSYMNESAIEAHGLPALKRELAAIQAIATSRQLAHALGLSMRADVDALNNTNFHTSNIFGLWVAPSFNDPDHYAPYLLQGGLQLPSRDYYLGETSRMEGIRDKYLTHIITMFRLAGMSDPETRAALVLDLETSIARQQISLADSEDIHNANNPWSIATFSSKAPGLDWLEFFRAAGLDHSATIIVWQPAAIAGEATLVATVPRDSWKNLLAYHLIEAYAIACSKALAEEHFAFFGKILSGTPQERPRDFRAQVLVSTTLRDTVGQLYAQRFFSPEAKAQAQVLVANLLAAFKVRLEDLTWMAPATKQEALAKLASLQVGVGYPDHWMSYASLEIKSDDLFGNLWRASLFQYRSSLAHIGKPVDRKEWCMAPQTVNAVNLPLDNGLNFPAAILQPPFFDPNAPAAANYGAIGTIIGHEISHTFDSEGAAFDAKGRVRNWWTPEDLAHFNSVTAALAAQYDTYRPFPDIAVNGKQTLGENIADVAGLSAALDGLHAALKGQTPPTIGGLSSDQQFFTAFGQNWGSITRDDSLRQQLLADPHAPGQYRAATVRNIDDWYPTFQVQPTDKLYLPQKDRVKIW